ncbi:hypothetical protein Theco_4116 (plasmid) [Thermobacillus composti KWC4]|jgi:uncharacterized protein YijF (DUF1287 family)|uniref:Uncharacterized protein n=1 Tax=Thermobacillus composti (strain DSM 18247 / JCM 13945 / KWC4) TaxID=717605 RepID=L0EKP1_THECK|nr:hypothetical protein [Thermobacillus composti]AGA60112.1 hypothetical protein Theco_4116 [Thermobacillus composti KWC4]
MNSLLESIRPEKLKGIQPGDSVVFRLVNGQQYSGIIETVSQNHDEFTFVGRGAHIHAIEIHRVEKHVPLAVAD